MKFLVLHPDFIWFTAMYGIETLIEMLGSYSTPKLTLKFLNESKELYLVKF